MWYVSDVFGFAWGDVVETLEEATPDAARSPVARGINVNQHLRAAGSKSAEDGRTAAKGCLVATFFYFKDLDVKHLKLCIDFLSKLCYTCIIKEGGTKQCLRLK